MTIRKQFYGNNSIEVANSLNDLSIGKALTGNITEAEKLLNKSIKIKQQLLSDTSNTLIESYINYAGILLKKPNYYDAVKVLMELNNKIKVDNDDAFMQKLFVLENLAKAYKGLNNKANQELKLLEAYSCIQNGIQEGLYPNTVITMQILNSLGEFYSAIENFDKAKIYYGLALRISKQFGAYSQDYQIALNNLANTYGGLRKMILH